jgi:hypothetical protein
MNDREKIGKFSLVSAVLVSMSITNQAGPIYIITARTGQDGQELDFAA